MGVDCFTCGKTFRGSEHDALMLFKNAKADRYFYKTEANGHIHVCKATEFKTIFERDIKPNFINGAEYSHISEYNPKN